MDNRHQASFFTLSTELILEINRHLDPSSCLNLAITCSRLYHQTQLIIDIHRAADTKYHVTSDLSPKTVLEILQNYWDHGVSNWHAREIEFWGSRLAWADWRAWELQPPDVFDLADQDAVRSDLGETEMKACLEMAKSWWDIPEGDFAEAVAELERGGDGFLKMLLIASCPRLRSIKFVKRGADSHTSLEWMTKAIEWSRVIGKWPPGFQSLRNVAVGVSAGTRLDDQEVHRRAFDFAGILNLPDITTVYMQDLDQEWDEDADVHFNNDEVDGYRNNAANKYRVPPASSSVQHIYLDATDRIEHGFRSVLLGASKGLRSMTVRGKNHSELDDMDIFVSSLGRMYPDTMETLTFYNPRNLHGYRCSVYRPEELSHYRALKQLSIAIDDVELDAYYNKPNGVDHPNRDQFITWITEEEIFPPSIEVLMIWSQWDAHFLEIEDGLDRLDILDDALVAIIDQKPEVYQNLRIIYVDATEEVLENPRQRLCFQKAIAAGREAGVHVHTVTNRDDGGSWKNFPAAPDRFDLKTGVYGKRPETWKINRNTGDWEDAGCEGCGKCEDCLRIYPEHVWQGVASE